MNTKTARQPNTTDDGQLACAFGWPWEMHFSGPLFACPLCAAEVERACAAFDAAVAAGTYDAQGYTPAERKAQQCRKAAA